MLYSPLECNYSDDVGNSGRCHTCIVKRECKHGCGETRGHGCILRWMLLSSAKFKPHILLFLMLIRLRRDSGRVLWMVEMTLAI